MAILNWSGKNKRSFYTTQRNASLNSSEEPFTLFDVPRSRGESNKERKEIDKQTNRQTDRQTDRKRETKKPTFDLPNYDKRTLKRRKELAN